MKRIIVAPSILSADFANLERDIKKIENAGADWVHVDVMDGHFVPNITIGAPVVKALRKTTGLIFDVHLMISNPEKYIKSFVDAGSDYITIHYESPDSNIEETIDMIKSFGIKAGISIKPNTPVKAIEHLLLKVDLVLIMTVEPGFGGQSFMDSCVSKISEVRAFLDKYELSETHVEVDGGINAETSKIAVDAGANALVAGSYIFNSSDMPASISGLRHS